MTGVEYGTSEGGQYGTSEGGHYGRLDKGRRVEITGPEEGSPSIRSDLILGIDISPEHTGKSGMTVEMPPLAGLTAENYLNGTIGYFNGPDEIFKISIQDIDHDENSGVVTIKGNAVEDEQLDGGTHEFVFEDIATENALAEVLEATGNDYRVYESPFSPITDETIQQAENTGGFEGTLSAGEDRDLPDTATGNFPPSYIPSQHPTTPIEIEDDGINSTRTCDPIESEFGTLGGGASAVEDIRASRAEAVLLQSSGDSVEISFGFDHDIPANWFAIELRIRKENMASAPDILDVKLNNNTLTSIGANQINYPGYEWLKGEIWAPNKLDANDENDHTIEIIKQQGDDDIYLDIIAPRDGRFIWSTPIDENVDNNYALSGPEPYPDRLPLVFDDPAAGALLDVVRWTVNVDESDPNTFLIIPETGQQITSSSVVDSGLGIYQTVYDVPSDIDTSRVYGGMWLTNRSDSTRTSTPKSGTIPQVLQRYRMDMDGNAISIITDETEYTGSFWDILTDLSEFAGRILDVEHGGHQSGRIESFVRGDPKLETRESERWVVTNASRETSRERYANVVVVTGEDISGGLAYQAVAEDEREIRRIQRISPPGDDGRRVHRVTDRSLTSNNDCRSKARSLLNQLTSINQAGDATIAPDMPRVGHPFLTPFNGEADEFEEHDEFSTIESASVTISPGTEETSVSFERVGGLTEVLESVANQEQSQQQTTTGGAGGGGSIDPELGIGYLSDEPLNETAFDIGGSAGEGTHGGFAVSRPDNMPSRSDATFIVEDATSLRNALNNAVSGDSIYIDDHIDISGFSSKAIPTGVSLVAAFCDPNIPGRGAVLHSDSYNRHHFLASGEIDMWGVSFQGPRQDYFDPRDKSGTESDYYTSPIRCSGTGATDGVDAFVYGCEFRGWTVGGIELGTSSDETQATIDRCTFINNTMETLGYGIYHLNGHADIERCYFDNNRHAIAGVGRNTESYYLARSMFGPKAIGHRVDMHSDSGNAGKFIHVERCTFPFTESYVYNSGQEGVRLRGESVETSWIRDSQFYHPTEPTPTGGEGDAYQQDVSGDSWLSFSQSGNAFGRRLTQGVGCPLNVPIVPKD